MVVEEHLWNHSQLARNRRAGFANYISFHNNNDIAPSTNEIKNKLESNFLYLI